MNPVVHALLTSNLAASTVGSAKTSSLGALMKRIVQSLVLVTVLVVATASHSVAEYTPRTFFTAAPISTFYTEDEMSEADRASIIRTHFKPLAKFTCTQWGVAEETPTSLILKNCADSSVRIQLYPATSGDSVVAVESSRSNGQAVDVAFFKVSSGDVIKEISPSELSSIGVEPLTENDFLLEKDHFKPSENEAVRLYVEQDGSLHGMLNTWMNPRWEARDQAYSVALAWNGQRFEKNKKPLTR